MIERAARVISEIVCCDIKAVSYEQHRIVNKSTGGGAIQYLLPDANI